MRKFLLALALTLTSNFVWAQAPVFCPTRPLGDNTNACASTAFVIANAGGGGGTPGGLNTQVQFNNAGAFGGSANLTWVSPVLSIGQAGSVVGQIKFLNATSGSISVEAVTGALGAVTLSLPAATDTLVGKATTDIFTNKTYDTAGTGNSFLINGLAVTANTGTGSVVRATSPTLVTPALGTPSSGTLTNATGLPISTGVSGLGAGIATWLATPSSANLATAVTDETGSGLLVFATSPVLTTPNLGTPSAATLTNATGLPISTGVSGLGAGIATFLATPSSANLASAVTDETGTGVLVFGTAPTFTTSITSPLVYGGSAAGSSLTLQSTSNGAPSGDSIVFKTGGSTRGTWLSGGNLGLGTETNPQAPLVVSANTTTGIAPPTGALLSVIGADTNTINVSLDVYGNTGGAAILGRQAGGTAASPTASVANAALLSFGGRGHDGSAFVTSNKALILFAAAENWSATAQGTYFAFYTTANTTTTRSEVMRIQNSGGVSIGATTDPGTGGLYVNGATITFNGLATDATHTDRTVCQDTTSKSLFFGSGAAGICLGTSGMQFKTAMVPMRAGLTELMQIPMLNYRYRNGYGDNGDRLMFGPTAQAVEAVLPDLAGHDASGRTINYDWAGLMFVGLRAIQELKADNDNLRREMSNLKRAMRR